MSKFFKKISANPTYQTLIGAGALSLIASLIPNGWKTIGEFFLYKLTIPVIGVVLLLCLGIFIAWLVSRISYFRKPAHYRRYTTDIIDGIRWRWTWPEVWEITPYCKIHDSRLYENRNVRYQRGACLSCDRCETPQLFDYQLNELTDRAKREIECNVNTDGWKNKINEVELPRINTDANPTPIDQSREVY